MPRPFAFFLAKGRETTKSNPHPTPYTHLVSSFSLNPEDVPIEDQLEQIYRLYLGLLGGVDAETGLGGRLLYAGEPDGRGCHLLRAANIAGAASLAASASAGALRQPMREGVIDFVVNSLDEALRILKNEIRKHEPVAVGVPLHPEMFAKEMIQRGVLPDLLAPHLPDMPELDSFAAQGARRVEEASLPVGLKFLMLTIPSAWSHRTGAIDALMLECLPPEDSANRRWLRFAPRYLGAAARRLRSLACDEHTAALIMERVAHPNAE